MTWEAEGFISSGLQAASQGKIPINIVAKAIKYAPQNPSLTRLPIDKAMGDRKAKPKIRIPLGIIAPHLRAIPYLVPVA